MKYLIATEEISYQSETLCVNDLEACDEGYARIFNLENMTEYLNDAWHKIEERK